MNVKNLLPTGNLLVPTVKVIGDLMIVGVKEVAQETDEYIEWLCR